MIVTRHVKVKILNCRRTTLPCLLDFIHKAHISHLHSHARSISKKRGRTKSVSVSAASPTYQTPSDVSLTGNACCAVISKPSSCCLGCSNTLCRNMASSSSSSPAPEHSVAPWQIWNTGLTAGASHFTPMQTHTPVSNLSTGMPTFMVMP